MKKTDLRPLWNATLDIYDAIKNICEANGLRYFAAYGTLIGSVRHNGFIPWDDDFDIYMPRPDYEKFIKLSKIFLPKEYSWCSIETDKDYRYSFGKVYENRKHLIEQIANKVGYSLHGGIYIDVFPIDGLPASRLFLFFWCVKRAVLRRLMSSNNVLGKVFLFFFHDKYKLNLYFNKWLSKRPFDSSTRVGAPSAYDSTFTPKRWWLLRSWFSSYKVIDFENRLVRIPSGYHEILSNIYGNYMQYPPEEKRVPSHQIIK